MSEWPDGLNVGPIREWPGALTRERKVAPFRTSEFDSYRRRPTALASTLDLLGRELRMLGASNAVMLVAIAPGDFRLDGKPRAQAKAEHPGVILSFDSNVGHMSYPCDTFTTWQDNLRAIALSLEALRKVDRYGVTRRGEQYRGFLGIESKAEPTVFSTALDAEAFLRRWCGPGWERQPLRRVLREAQRTTHPDMSGDAETFRKVSLAEAKLREEGLL